MLRIHSLAWKKDTPLAFVADGAAYRYVLNGRGYTSRFVYFAVDTLYGYKHPKIDAPFGRSERLPGEHLAQGGIFSPLGDKSVSNIQWKVDLYDEKSWDQVSGGNVISDYENTHNHFHPVVDSAGQVRVVAESGSIYEDWSEPQSGPIPYYAAAFHTQTRPVVAGTYDDRTGITTYTKAVYQSSQYVSRQGAAYTTYRVQQVWCARASTPTSAMWVTVTSAQSKISKSQFAAFYRDPSSIPPAPLPHMPSGYVAVSGMTVTMIRHNFDIEAHELQLPGWRRIMANFHIKAAPVRYIPTDLDRSGLCQTIMESINLFDGNMIAYAKDFAEVGSSIKSVLDLVRDYKDPAAWASAWLSLRFGDRLQIADTARLIESVRRKNSSYSREFLKYRARNTYLGPANPDGITARTDIAACVVLSGGLLGDMENLLAAPYRWDLLPTLENVWDLIPFSFVVDWFYDVQSILNTIDQMSETRFIDARAQYASQREEVSMPLELVSEYKGTIKMILYSRHPAPVLSWLRLRSFVGYAPTSLRPVNMIDGASLLVQSLH